MAALKSLGIVECVSASSLLSIQFPAFSVKRELLQDGVPHPLPEKTEYRLDITGRLVGVAASVPMGEKGKKKGPGTRVELTLKFCGYSQETSAEIVRAEVLGHGFYEHPASSTLEQINELIVQDIGYFRVLASQIYPHVVRHLELILTQSGLRAPGIPLEMPVGPSAATVAVKKKSAVPKRLVRAKTVAEKQS